ncbi:MAG: hypothetical protein GY925_27730 [Actinomycetia bacterium]|nr:hypothetical protein [Actinomycetes bacterium]
MPDLADEERLARFVEKLWRRELGRESGSERHYEPGSYDVDFLYPQATPPTALEITSLRNEPWKSGTMAAKRHVPRLDQSARRGRHGHWRLQLDASVNVKEITADTLDLGV